MRGDLNTRRVSGCILPRDNLSANETAVMCAEAVSNLGWLQHRKFDLMLQEGLTTGSASSLYHLTSWRYINFILILS